MVATLPGRSDSGFQRYFTRGNVESMYVLNQLSGLGLIHEQGDQDPGSHAGDGASASAPAPGGRGGSDSGGYAPTGPAPKILHFITKFLPTRPAPTRPAPGPSFPPVISFHPTAWPIVPTGVNPSGGTVSIPPSGGTNVNLPPVPVPVPTVPSPSAGTTATITPPSGGGGGGDQSTAPAPVTTPMPSIGGWVRAHQSTLLLVAGGLIAWHFIKR